MRIARLVLVLALSATAFVGCGPQVPPMGSYATVSGQVTDAANNAPIPGAVVTINSVLNATTDANGTFRIQPVPGGPWDVQISATNYTTIVLSPAPLAAGEQRSLPVQLTHT
jgi:hypothetical protein